MFHAWMKGSIVSACAGLPPDLKVPFEGAHRKTKGAMDHHYLRSSVDNCHWGFFDAARSPVLQIRSGDQVTIETVSGAAEMLPGDGFWIPPELALIHDRAERYHGPHILTGPVAIEGAKPGHVLEVRILEVGLRQDWGYTVYRPLAGTLPEEFDDFRLVHTALDIERGIARPPWGGELRVAPFFGVMGVAPPPNWGRITSVAPRANGGNIDNKELVAGATLFLPVFVEGALFSCGDGHARQGDGEVCVTAIETALCGTFEFILRDDLSLRGPRAETADHYIAIGLDADLDQAAAMALRDMITLLGQEAGMSREDAYMLCSIAADLRITQTVNVIKGVHMMIAKSVVADVRASNRRASGPIANAASDESRSN